MSENQCMNMGIYGINELLFQKVLVSLFCMVKVNTLVKTMLKIKLKCVFD